MNWASTIPLVAGVVSISTVVVVLVMKKLMVRDVSNIVRDKVNQALQHDDRS